MTYKLKTPNSLYSGVTEGVPFSQGLGQTEDENTRNILVNDYKYEDITPEPEKEKTIEEMTVPELKDKAKELGFEGFSNLKKEELLALIKGEPEDETGDPPVKEEVYQEGSPEPE